MLPRRCWDCDPLRQDGEGSRRPLLLFSREFHSFDIDTFIKLQLETGRKMNCRSDLYWTINEPNETVRYRTLAAAVHLQRYHQSSTTESMRQRNNNNVGFILLVFLLQKSSI